MAEDSNIDISAEDLEVAYGDNVLQSQLTFEVARGEIFIIMGGSGCGKSSLLRIMVGLKVPTKGHVYYQGESLWSPNGEVDHRLMKQFGVMYQSGALWSSMSLAENIALPLSQYTDLNQAQINDMVSYKLSLVGLAGFEDYSPADISGGMRKRVGIARAMALDPDIIFLDEPSAGLDPISGRRLDELILELRDSLGTTFVIVTHELESIYTIADNVIFLDNTDKTITARGKPQDLLKQEKTTPIYQFLTRSDSLKWKIKVNEPKSQS